MMMGTDLGFGWGGIWLGWFMMIGFTVAVIVLVVWLAKLFARNTVTNAGAPCEQARREPALDLLQARYARGEMTKEEYLDVCATFGHMN